MMLPLARAALMVFMLAAIVAHPAHFAAQQQPFGVPAGLEDTRKKFLRIDTNVGERRDPFVSTRAAFFAQ